jgi:hypothetical protein
MVYKVNNRRADPQRANAIRSTWNFGATSLEWDGVMRWQTGQVRPPAPLSSDDLDG